MNNLKKSVFFAIACGLCVITGNAFALGNQWYIGVGGGSSWLQPNPRQAGIDIDRRLGVGGNLFVGMDVDDRTSGQLTLYGLGDAELDNEELVAYQAFDGSVLFRFFDTNDLRVRRSSMHLALYGRFALGFLNRDTDERLVNDSAVYFGAGGGAEWFINNAFSIRLEGMYHDKDAAYGSLQLVGRFGGRRGLPSSRPLPIPDGVSDAPVESPSTTDKPSAPKPSAPDTSVVLVPGAPTGPTVPSKPVESSQSTNSTEPTEPAEKIEQVESVELLRPVEKIKPIEPATQIEPAVLAEQAEKADLIEPIEPSVPKEPETPTGSESTDQDGDNVSDAEDRCIGSRAGYPVRSTGCALFDGVLSGVNFVAGSSALLPDATDQLDFLANVLIQYPKAKVELHAHTDNAGTVADQTALTRARVRTIGAYLVRQGVAVSSLTLRSFGASRPLYDNKTAQGRTGNNRVEVIEIRN